ncbi:unnamed protein product [Polarella glacialis]|uniref:BTB domain-containing protein n=1 Tax=Polarella glacialis TaxID=89957 RepID=A0A813G0K3_POLGL|nr:unnamed protein product [Polarella glacialis]
MAGLSQDIDRMLVSAVDTMQRLEQDVRQLHGSALKQLRRQVQELREQASAASLRKKEATLQPSLPVILVPASAEAGDDRPIANNNNKHFFTMLKEPAVAIRVNDTMLHVHQHILEGIPFFAALLSGDWSDAAAPAVELPCSAEEFALLLQRLYTGQVLGSPELPVSGCAAALRLSAAAAMLLIDEKLPELQNMVRGSILTHRDADMAVAAAAALPPTVAAACAALHGAPSDELPPQRLQEMILSATTKPAQASVSAVLAARHGRLDLDQVAEAAQRLMSQAIIRWQRPRCAWAVVLARDHLDCARALAVFKCVPQVEKHSRGCRDSFQAVAASLRKAFAEHLLRCAGSGMAAEALGFVVGQATSQPQVSSHRIKFHAGMENCMITVAGSHLLLFDCSEGSATLAKVLLAAPGERQAIAAVLTRLPPATLAQTLSKEVMAVLGIHGEQLVQALAADASAAKKWASPGRLAAVPLAQRRLVCAGLFPILDDLSAEASAIVVATLR